MHLAGRNQNPVTHAAASCRTSHRRRKELILPCGSSAQYGANSNLTETPGRRSPTGQTVSNRPNGQQIALSSDTLDQHPALAAKMQLLVERGGVSLL